MNEYEVTDFFSDKKTYRHERRRASRLDRSKYKKTDQEKRPAEPSGMQHLKKGVVVHIQGPEILVDHEGSFIPCTLRGVLKKDKSLFKNLVVVGDVVCFSEDGAIHHIEERKSVLSRAAHLSQQQEHLLAANVDQVLITVSVVDPPLRPTIIDRYLIAAQKGGLNAVILCNKMDLLEDPTYNGEGRAHEKTLMHEVQAIYQAINIPFIPLSTVTKEGLDQLIEIMKDKTSVFSGQSGCGKSSLINATCAMELKVGKTVARSKKGAHTTSFARLIKLPFGGYVVDTPGIKSFGIWNIGVRELPALFPEIQAAAGDCKYQDCSHTGEDGCAIPDAIHTQKVSMLRYESYLNIFGSLQQEHLRR